MTAPAANDPMVRRGFLPLYRPGETNRCPGCGRMHWYIGRVSAECGFCATAVPLAETASVRLTTWEAGG